MPDDDEVRDDESHDPIPASVGPRRSTFTPPPGAAQEAIGASDEAADDNDEHDDDELANALAAEFTRVASGPITVIPTITGSLPAIVPDPDPVPAPVDPPAAGAAPAWANAPAPAPEALVEGPRRPMRRSLPDDELMHTLDDAARQPGGTLNVIEHLESQLRLREEEAREFRTWEATMLSLGTPEAIAAVEETRPEFTGVLPPMPTSSVLPPLVPETAAPEPEPELGLGREPEPSTGAGTVAPEPTVPAFDPDAFPRAEPFVEPAADVVPQTYVEPPEDDFVVSEFASPLMPDEQSSTEPPAYAQHVDEPTTGETSEFDRLFPEPGTDEPAEVPEEEPAARTWIIDPDASAGSTPPLIEPPVAWTDEPPAPVGLLPEPVHLGAEPIGIQPATDESVPLVEEEPEPAEEEPEPEPPPAVERPPVPDSPFAPPALVEPPKYGMPPVTDPFAPSDIADTVTTDAQPAAPEAPAAASAFSFDELLSGEVGEEPPRADAPSESPDDQSETVFVEPLPVLDADAVPVSTGSISVIDQAYEEELPDDVDETDRAFVPSGPVSVDTSGIAVVPTSLAAPSGPISTIRVAPDGLVLADNEPKSPGAFSLEESGLEPTPLDQRVGRAARLFWLWFAANSSVISLALGAVIFSLGISLRQAIVAALAGVAISFLPLGLGTLAGKRSGLPTMVVSRATFGLVGNILPALLALVTRLFWGAALLWVLAISVTAVLTGGRISGGLSEFQLTIIGLAVAFLLALLIAFVGYHLIARIQLILSVVSGLLVLGLIVLTANRINVSTALTTPDGPWILAVTGAVLVFSFVGLVWANSGADIARYQRFSSSGAGSMLWATFGATLPAFALIAYGALLAASDPRLASGLVTDPIGTLAGMLPLWYPIPLIAAIGLSLLSGVIITLYSGGFALQALGIRAPRQWSIVIVGVVLLALSFLLVIGVGGGIQELVRDVATTLAVPTAAWAGIFAAELMIRNRRFETDSLLRRGGVYPDVRWLNFPMLIVISVVGLGFTSATVGWLGWEGYLFSLAGIPLDSDLAASDLGVLVALVLGLLTPIVGGIPTIRKQESMRV